MPVEPLVSAPGPRGYPLLGIMPKLRRDPLGFLTASAATFGDVVCLSPRRLYLVNHPTHVERILRGRREIYSKNRLQAAARAGGRVGHDPRFLGLTSVALSEGEHWRRQRSLVQPIFARRPQAALAERVNGAARDLVARWSELSSSSRVVDVEREMLTLVLDVLALSLFGDSLHEPRDVRRVAGVVGEVHEGFERRTRGRLRLPAWLKTPRQRRFTRALGELDAFVSGATQAHREAAQAGRESGDLLGLLLQARDDTGQALDARQIHDEITMLSLLGHKTTATALAWTLHLLGQAPEADARLQGELQRVLGARVPTLEDLPQLVYLRQVIEESLRLYPPTWLIGRIALEDDTLGGYRIPARATVIVSPYLLHRHPAYWEHPERFDPERFDPLRVGSGRAAYLPFGAGERACIASQFAQVEMALVLCAVLRAFRLERAPGPPVVPQPRLVLRPRRGLPMTLRPRDARGA